MYEAALPCHYKDIINRTRIMRAFTNLVQSTDDVMTLHTNYINFIYPLHTACVAVYLLS